MDAWLAQLENQPDGEERLLLVEDLDTKLPRAEAVKHLGLIIEAVAENYAEYRDYNSTTTQSDRGDLLYTLLDFLRLRVHYDRVAWHLKPVLAAHAILMRQGAAVLPSRGAGLWPIAPANWPTRCRLATTSCARNMPCDCPRWPTAWESDSCARWPSIACARS